MPLLIIDLFQPCDIAVHYTDLFPIPLMLHKPVDRITIAKLSELVTITHAF